MNKIKYYLNKYKIIISISCLIVILILMIIPKNVKNKEEVSVIKNIDVKEPNKQEIEINKIKVDVKGSVVNPGTYELEENSRVQDAINIAGGLSENANIEYINLSKKLKDEMVIIIYSNEYVEDYKNNNKEPVIIKYECNCPDKVNDACINENDLLNDYEKKEKSNNNNATDSNEKQLVSINNGSLEELMSLSGIGESKAKAIIEYREQNNGFKSLDEIMNVSGIGESAYSKIKDNIEL